jgi:hypothetical protein
VTKSKEVNVESITTEDNPADMLTKVVSGSKFDFCIQALGVS